jgi:hypothetical protein
MPRPQNSPEHTPILSFPSSYLFLKLQPPCFVSTQIKIKYQSDVARFADLGVLASMQPTHAMEDMAFASDRLGADRLECSYAPNTIMQAYAASDAAASTLSIPFGSDFPVEPLDPRFGLYSAVTRQYFYPGWRFQHAKMPFSFRFSKKVCFLL